MADPLDFLSDNPRGRSKDPLTVTKQREGGEFYEGASPASRRRRRSAPALLSIVEPMLTTIRPFEIRAPLKKE